MPPRRTRRGLCAFERGAVEREPAVAPRRGRTTGSATPAGRASRSPLADAFVATRSRADCERGLRAISAADGRIARRGVARSVGVEPQAQTGKSGGQVQPCSDVAQEALDDPVLERVERDHGEPAARPQHLERCGQPALERAELVVDLDPESLEDALRRMPLAEAGRRRDRRLDRLDELAGALERLLLRAAARSRARSGARSAPRRSGGRCRRARARRLSFTTSRADTVALGSMRMSSGASTAYEKPRSGRSICIDETPRSSRIASARTPFSASWPSTSENSPCRRRVLTPWSAAEALEVRRDRRVAVDRDQLPVAVQAAGEQLGMAAGAERAVDRPSPPAAGRGSRRLRPRGRGRGRPQLARRSATSSALPSSSRLLGAPGGAIPDLEVVADSERRSPRARASRASSSGAGITMRPCRSSSPCAAAPKKTRRIMRDPSASGSRVRIRSARISHSARG